MKFIKQFFEFFADLIRSREFILELTKKDLEKRYLGSNLGILWAFVQPSITIFIFWFVFQVGFKNAPIGHIPFILWITSGILPWFFFTESLSTGTNSVIEYSYLVSKVVFRVSILPIIKILSALLIHLFFIVVLVVMFLLYGYKPDLYYLQVFYYLIATIILLLGLTWITSSVMVFLKDIGQLVGVGIQFGFWMTPIFWNINNVPARFQFILKLNPVYYIVEGYRNTFIYHHWFWETPFLTAYFWVFVLATFVIGAIVFRKLRPYFADVI